MFGVESFLVISLLLQVQFSLSLLELDLDTNSDITNGKLNKKHTLKRFQRNIEVQKIYKLLNDGNDEGLIDKIRKSRQADYSESVEEQSQSDNTTVHAGFHKNQEELHRKGLLAVLKGIKSNIHGDQLKRGHGGHASHEHDRHRDHFFNVTSYSYTESSNPSYPSYPSMAPNPYYSSNSYSYTTSGYPGYLSMTPNPYYSYNTPPTMGTYPSPSMPFNFTFPTIPGFLNITFPNFPSSIMNMTNNMFQNMPQMPMVAMAPMFNLTSLHFSDAK